MGVIDFGEASKKLKEAREGREGRESSPYPITINVEVTLYEDEYGVRFGDINDGATFHELASAFVKTGAKMLLSGTPEIEIGDPVAYGFIFDNGPVFTCNYVGKEDMSDEQAKWFESRLGDLRDAIMYGRERKNDKT